MLKFLSHDPLGCKHARLRALLAKNVTMFSSVEMVADVSKGAPKVQANEVCSDPKCANEHLVV